MARNDQNAQLAARVDGIPPEVLLRTDRTLRYERGGMVYASDGKLGTLRQVVVDLSAVMLVGVAHSSVIPPGGI